jgi:Clp amino terminal domain, pathogenicity island component
MMSISHKSVWLARGLYRQSLRLLPWRFYAEYAEQMALDFDDLLQDSARQGSPFLVAKTIVRAVADVFLSAVRERFALLHGELDITPRVNTAIAIASSYEYQSCGVSADGRLLIGLATEPHGLAGVVLRELGVHADRLRASVEVPKSSIEHNATVDEPDDIGTSVSYVRQLTNAAECARTFGHAFVGTEHLALSLLAETNGDAARLIERLGVDPNSLRDLLAERTRKLELARPRRLSGLSKA